MTKAEVKGWIFRVIKRILLEFSIPAISATVWYFTTKTPSFHGWGIFFVSVSWFTAQIFRIIKQQRVEGEFDLVKSKLGEMVDRIEDQTKKVFGFSTVADSNTFIFRLAWIEGKIRLFLVNESQFTAYLVSVRLSEITKDGDYILLKESHYNIVHPVLWYGFDHIFLPSTESKRYVVHHQTRTGSDFAYSQFIFVEKVDGKDLIAFTKWVDGKILYDIPDNFPGYIKSNPELLFKDARLPR